MTVETPANNQTSATLTANEVEHIRNDFPMLSQEFYGKRLVYLDNGATTQKPQQVIDAITNFYTNQYGTVRRGVYQLSEQSTGLFFGTREKVKNFINAASTDEIIFTKGTTEAINLVASTYGRAFINEGDEVIITELEHHANIVPWQQVCLEKNATLKVVPINDAGELMMDEFDKMLTDKTKFVSVNYVSNALGTVNPVKEIIDKAHAVGAVVLVDGAQSAPHMAVDVQDLGCDFYAFSGHKIYGPTGVGVLYGKYQYLEAMPPYQCGGDMIKTVTFEKTDFAGPPSKFEAGTPAIAQVIGLGAALDYVNHIGLDRIAAYEQELLDYGTQKLSAVEGLKIIGTAKEKASLIAFVLEQAHSSDIGTLIDHEAIAIRTGHHCAQPVMQHFGVTGTARASFAFYNTREEIDVLVNALHKVIDICS